MNNERVSLFNGFILDLGRGSLTRAGKPVHLRPQSYEVLKYLVQNKGRLISKDKLIEEIWHGRAVTDGSLVKCIEEVRAALGEDSETHVRNVRGRGYIFDPAPVESGESPSLVTEQVDIVKIVVEEHEDSNHWREPRFADDHFPDQWTNPNAVTPGSEVAASTDWTPVLQVVPSIPRVGSALITSQRNRRALLMLTGLLITAAVATLVYLKYFRGSRSQTITSIAVLPFANASGNEDLQYLSDGLSETLINSLSQMPHLKVIASSSAFKYKGKETDPQEVAGDLGVQAILVGRISQRGDTLLVSAELVDARDKTHVWGEQYSRKAPDIQTVQQEIARAISERLRMRLSNAQERQLIRDATQNSQAYQFYLNGLFYYRKRGFENVKKALDYFDRAVELDPKFALAWIGVARANTYLVGNSLVDPEEPLARVKTATQKALELDDTLAEARLELASLKQQEWDWAEAEREYKRAIESNPNLVEARIRYSSYLSVMGRHNEAWAENQVARELDPLETGSGSREGWMLYLARRYDDALQKQQEAVKAGSDARYLHFNLGLTYEAKGMYEQAIAEYQKFISIEGKAMSAQIYLGSALAMSGKRSEAQAILKMLKLTKEYVSPTELTILYIGLGDKEGAIASLEKGYATHDLQMLFLKVDPHYDSLRSDPTFQDLIRRVGLPP